MARNEFFITNDNKIHLRAPEGVSIAWVINIPGPEITLCNNIEFVVWNDEGEEIYKSLSLTEAAQVAWNNKYPHDTNNN